MILDFITWDASPVIFSIGPLALRWYGLAFAIGFIIGYNIVAKMFKHEGAPEKWLGILLTYVVVATIIGSRLGHVFFYQWDYYSQHPGEIFVTKKSVSWTVDRLVVPVAMVAGLIRLGNLMNSEIYGGVTDLPWGFIFVRDGQTLPMHPTQIYEALCYFALFGVLMWMYWKKNAQERPWLISGVFFIGVFVSRFLIEYVKNVQVGKEIEMIATYGINMGQLLSIPFIIMGVVMVVYAMTHPRLKLDYPNKFAEELANNKR